MSDKDIADASNSDEEFMDTGSDAGESEVDINELNDADEGDEAEPEEPEEPEPAVEGVAAPEQVKRKRGRPPGSGRKNKQKMGRFQTLAIPLDPNGNPYPVDHDELVLPDDPLGKTKVDSNGNLLGGREYRCRTFTISGKGQRLYMLATEPARCVGFRDSYMLFQRHRMLLKIKLDDAEKMDLIFREMIPYSYKGRAIGVVTARSVFREFGARVIVGGKFGIDDYNEEPAKANGTFGELADPADKLPLSGQEYDRTQYVAWLSNTQRVDPSKLYENNLKSVLQAQKQDADIDQDMKPDAQLVESAFKDAANYNSLLAQRRKALLARTLAHPTIEPHTGVRFVPGITQPTASHVYKLTDVDCSSTLGLESGPPSYNASGKVVVTTMWQGNVDYRTP